MKTGFVILLLSVTEKVADAISAGNFFRIIKGPEALKVNSTDLDLTDPFTSVATASESGFKDQEKLEPRENPPELYRVRWGVADGCDYYLKLPSGTERFGVYSKKDIGKITALDSDHIAPAEEYGFWMAHGDFPSINAKNYTGYSITPNVYFEGEKYNIDRVTDAKELVALKAGQLHYSVIERGGILS